MQVLDFERLRNVIYHNSGGPSDRQKLTGGRSLELHQDGGALQALVRPTPTIHEWEARFQAGNLVQLVGPMWQQNSGEADSLILCTVRAF